MPAGSTGYLRRWLRQRGYMLKHAKRKTGLFPVSHVDKGVRSFQPRDLAQCDLLLRNENTGAKNES